MPFWLAMIRPVAVDFGQDLLDALELPGLDDQAGWSAVDAEMLDLAAAAHLTVGPHPWLLVGCANSVKACELAVRTE